MEIYHQTFEKNDKKITRKMRVKTLRKKRKIPRRIFWNFSAEKKIHKKLPVSIFLLFGSKNDENSLRIFLYLLKIFWDFFSQF